MIVNVMKYCHLCCVGASMNIEIVLCCKWDAEGRY